jgi:hypothetical protein
VGSGVIREGENQEEEGRGKEEPTSVFLGS